MDGGGGSVGGVERIRVSDQVGRKGMGDMNRMHLRSEWITCVGSSSATAE